MALGPPPSSLPSLFRDLPQTAAALTGSGPAWHSVELTPGQGLGGLGLGAEEMQEAPKEGSLDEGPSWRLLPVNLRVHVWGTAKNKPQQA